MTELPSREDALTAYHQAALDDPMRPLLHRYASGRLVDREAIDYDEIADWFWAITPNEAKHVLRRLGEETEGRIAAALGVTDEAPTTKIQHLCGLMGFGEPDDICPACEQGRSND
jgi:hypothetical protein